MKLDSLVNTVVKLPYGNLVSVIHVSSIKFSDQFALPNVLCVPSFNYNVLSASKSTHNIFLVVSFSRLNIVSFKTYPHVR